MSIPNDNFYPVTSTGIMTDARIAAWASANGVANANYWIKIRRNKYIVSQNQLSRRDARLTRLQGVPHSGDSRWTAVA